jgi:1,4-dihydroxy-2-naphthoyl-CoA hydrolase
VPDSADPELTRFVREAMPFTNTLGVEVVRSDPEAVVFTARWAPEHCTSNGVLHGGFLMAVVDSAGAACAIQHLPEGAGTSTIESKTNFLGAVREGVVTVTATPVHVGRTTIVIQTDARDERGKLVTRSLQTQAVLQPR